MDIGTFLSKPLVALTGYILTVISSVIAIWQFFGKSKAIKELANLQIEITNIKNNVQQGDKSQYFQANSGPVSIDNRG